MDSITSLQCRNSQDPNTSSSLSLPSEPPDVGNWFASYEYKYPDSDSNVGFEDSAFRGFESENNEETEGEEETNLEGTRVGDEVIAGDKPLASNTYFEDDKHNDDLAMAKDLDSFTSRSALLSEPPDIKNWFSSYVYESPVSGTSSLFVNSVSEENGCGEKGFNSENLNEHEVGFENVHPSESVKHDSSSDTNTKIKQPASRDDDSVEMKKSISCASTSHLENIFQPRMQDRTLQQDVSPTKCEETISLSHGSAGGHGEQTPTLLNVDKNCTRPPDIVQKNDIKEATSIASIEQENRGSRAGSANRFSQRNSTCLREKENGRDIMPMNGFVTTRQSRNSGFKDENCWKKTQEMVLNDSTNRGTVPLTCKKQVKRKALDEVTNLQERNAMEIPGKWQCPRKGKSNVGPALKQLRLERWVHRN